MFKCIVDFFQCDKLKKKRSSLVGAFVSTHGKSIDDVDRSIVEARTSLNEVTQELQERVYRWKQIELLCGFNIINNNGLAYLESVLYRNINGRPGSLKGIDINYWRLNRIYFLNFNFITTFAYIFTVKQLWIYIHNKTVVDMKLSIIIIRNMY